MSMMEPGSATSPIQIMGTLQTVLASNNRVAQKEKHKDEADELGDRASGGVLGLLGGSAEEKRMMG